MELGDQRVADCLSNQEPLVAPINKLPSEILLKIMGIVVAHASSDVKSTKGMILSYPEVLSYVCSRWRQVVVHSPNLWSHIHMPMYQPPGSRVVALLDHAGRSPLSLHLHDDRERQGDSPANLTPFLVSIASRLRSLELVARSDGLSKTETSALSACLATCATGSITELVIRTIGRCSWEAPAIFIKARDYRSETTAPTYPYPEPNWVNVDVSNERFEDFLGDITILRLFKFYPRWTSGAYSGLVELRLLDGTLAKTTIAESLLLGILKSSPGLRILHLDLIIVDLVPLGNAILDPIVLSDLRVLNLNWNGTEGVEMFFRWLAPCPRLFQLSFLIRQSCSDCHEEYFGHPATIAFLAGSNITMVHADLRPREIISLVSHCHDIRVVAYDSVVQYEKENVPFHFDTLYLIKCEFEVDALRQLIQSSSVQRLIVYNSKILRDCCMLPADQVVAVLSDMCPNVLTVPKGDPNPIAGWEAFWFW